MQNILSILYNFLPCILAFRKCPCPLPKIIQWFSFLYTAFSATDIAIENTYLVFNDFSFKNQFVQEEWPKRCSHIHTLHLIRLRNVAKKPLIQFPNFPISHRCRVVSDQIKPPLLDPQQLQRHFVPGAIQNTIYISQMMD